MSDAGLLLKLLDGAILSAVDTAVQWPPNMQWKGSAP